MSKRKNGDPIYTGIYGPFKGNPAGNRLSTIERIYIRILTEVSVNRFKWVGLPESVDPRFIELSLFNQALCVFLWDDDYKKYFALRGTGAGPINMYDNPTSFSVIGGSYNKVLRSGSYTDPVTKVQSPPECVPIWGNFLRIPDKDIIFMYATRLAKMDSSIDTLAEAMKYTTVITAPENERLSWNNIFRQRQEGQPVILGLKGLDLTNIQAWPVAPDKDAILNLQIAKSRVWNECMTLLGINNSNQDKKERMVTDEVKGNEDQVVANSGVALNSRRNAVEQINRLWDLSIDVGWNPQARAMAGEYMRMAAIDVDLPGNDNVEKPEPVEVIDA